MGCSHQYLHEFKSYLVLKNYSPYTFESFCSSIANYFRFAVDHKGEFSTSQEYAKAYLLSRHYSGKSWSAVNLDYSSLVIFFKVVIKQKWDYPMIPRPKMAKKLPLTLSFSEIEKLINCVANIKHQTIIISLYATG